MFQRSLRQPDGWLGLLFVLGIAAVFIGHTFGYDFVLGRANYWRVQDQDVTQYIAGFNMYLAAPWQLPLLAFDSLNYPVGTRVTFVDAIPIYALLLKVFLPTSFAPFNPFGFWVALCFMLQGLGGWWICRELKTNSWFFLGGLTIILLMFPALMARVGHISLMSHWILLFALALYVRGNQRMQLPTLGWSLLLVTAFYINVYLFVMGCGIFTAALFDLNRRISFKDIRSFMTPFILLLVSAYALLLPLPASEVTREWGFGYYSMNLLSPVTGGKFLDWGGAEAPGQYEGFNYLGLGVLIAMPLAYFLRKRIRGHALRRHLGLIALCMIFTIYALSNQIYFSGEQILTIAYPSLLDGLTAQFRASGRFFWPVGYCLTIFTLLVLFRSLSQKKFWLVMSGLVILQVADLNDRYNVLRATTRSAQAAQPLDPIAWDAYVGDNVKVLYFYPKFKCGKNSNATLLPVMQYAAERRLKLNTGYIARYTPDCEDTRNEIAGSNPANSAYVFVRRDYPAIDHVKALFPAKASVRCSAVQFAYICLIGEKG